jgi:hypothetical protein
MFTRDEVYSMQSTLNNLLLLKYAYDAGLDMKEFHEYETMVDFCYDPGWELFITSIGQLFEIIEIYSPYCNLDEEERNYWLSLAGYKDYFESQGVIVMLDDRITPFKSRMVSGNYSMSSWYSGQGEISWIEGGIVFMFDEEEGPLDYSDSLSIIIQTLQQSIAEQESVNYEMAS